MSTSNLPFVEAFGPTLQGEGPAAGRVSDFLRFGGCNLSCSWCDSAYTWNARDYDLREEITMMTPAQVLDAAPNKAPLMIVTGGEPLLNQHKDTFIDVLDGIRARGQLIHIETNGTILPNPQVQALVDTFIVSPKLAHAGAHKRTQDPKLHPGWGTLHPAVNAHMKVVVEEPADIDTTVDLATNHHWPLDKVWVMPEGTTTETLTRRWPWVAQDAANAGINASHRLHVLAWNDERGH